ncbi:MAG: hypothetical protein GTO22_10615, partial [Gemmatimonadales bacterium]|nr:hypothetical protein [Gemmatimonadales bacterium]
SGAILEFSKTGGAGQTGAVTMSGDGTWKISETAGTSLEGTSSGSSVAMGSGALIHVDSGNYRFGYAIAGDWSGNLSDLQIDAGAEFRAGATPIRVDSLDGGGALRIAGVFTVGVDDGDGTFSGAITNDGGVPGSPGSFTKEGSGTQILDGANTYSGDTVVNGGTLLVNGTHLPIVGTGTYTINSTGTLGGDGTIGGNITDVTINSGAFLSPGDAPGAIGTLTLDANLDISAAVGGPDGSLLFDVGDTVVLT